MVNNFNEELLKYNIKSILDLALLVPYKYVDNRLKDRLEDGKVATLECKIVSIDRSKKYFTIGLFAPALNIFLDGIFFKATKYHYNRFQVGNSFILQGRIKRFLNRFQLLQPKILKEYGKIIPKYKYPFINEKELKSLLKRFLTRENLIKEGLKSNEIDLLLNIHFPLKVVDFEKRETILILKELEALNYMRKLRKKRKIFLPIKALLGGDLDKFFKALPFELTIDQKRAIEDIKKDLSNSKKAAKRVVIGDVGSGKTMVILASAAIAAKDKSILMVPTSILARQIYEEAKKYLSSFLNISLVTQKEVINDYKSADFIIGTHALLYKSDLPKAPLIMVDEQHRFGTSQRVLLEKLVSKDSLRPHYLQFSATPIPRTQALLESELVDLSLIKTLPFKKDITTQIIKKSDFKMLLAHIKSEISKNHQILIVYPLVEPSDEVPYLSLNEAQSFWKKYFKNVFVTYGKDAQKEDILLKFKEEGDILLSTTVIEVGISLPRLTTIVIVGAERFGLATLHQLRGRVGREGLKSWCFLYTNLSHSKRLEEFCNTLNGFEIARLDLKYRNSGDLLEGTVQSGNSFRWLNLAEDEEIIKKAKERV